MLYTKPTCVFFDLETGGLAVGSPIIEFAGIAIDLETWKEIETFEAKIQVDVTKCEPKALEINHYSDEAWKDAKTEDVFLRMLTSFLERYKSVRQISQRGRPYLVTRMGGHNVASFDVERLSHFYKTRRKFFPCYYAGSLDTLRLASWAFLFSKDKPENMKLATLAAHFGYDWTGESHTALADTRASIFVAQKLLEMIKEKK